jgi:3-oxoacyl-[acyl-carrier-protein] synthase III
VVGCSNLQRPYPAIAIEVQAALGARGFAYDMNVACSSATFAIQNAVDALRSGHARLALVLNPELTSGHTNFELREFHFIFGDACTAVLLEREETAEDAGRSEAWEVLGTRLVTRFSNNIRNDAGFLNRCEEPAREPHELLFRQNGRQVANEVCPMVAEHLRGHLADAGIPVERVRRLWLHQANLNMNRTIAKTLLGREVTPEEAPIILDEYANTSSAGSVIAFHKHREGDRGRGGRGALFVRRGLFDRERPAAQAARLSRSRQPKHQRAPEQRAPRRIAGILRKASGIGHGEDHEQDPLPAAVERTPATAAEGALGRVVRGRGHRDDEDEAERPAPECDVALERAGFPRREDEDRHPVDELRRREGEAQGATAREECAGAGAGPEARERRGRRRRAGRGG